MRVALVSDIHGNLPALEAVVRDLEGRGVDRVVNLGDSVSGPLLPLETARFLMGTAWVHLAGNHERQVLEGGPMGESDAYARMQLGEAELSWMRSLPGTGRLGAEVFLCHGTPDSDLVYFLETVEGGAIRAATPAEVEARSGAGTAPVIACGHSHTPRVVRTGRGQLIVNPGSVGLQAFHVDEPYRHSVVNGSPEARYALLEKGVDGWEARILKVAYDPAPMARLAALRGRPAWERALLTGY
jgi:predicted phosphodiesterase